MEWFSIHEHAQYVHLDRTVRRTTSVQNKHEHYTPHPGNLRMSAYTWTPNPVHHIETTQAFFLISGNRMCSGWLFSVALHSHQQYRTYPIGRHHSAARTSAVWAGDDESLLWTAGCSYGRVKETIETKPVMNYWKIVLRFFDTKCLPL